jgi:hypothetical protein
MTYIRDGAACGWVDGGVRTAATLGDLIDGRGILRQNDQGPLVERMQAVLLAKGYDVGPTGADGSFGDCTRAGLEAFQMQNGLGERGYVGPETAQALFLDGVQPTPGPMSSGFEDALMGPTTLVPERADIARAVVVRDPYLEPVPVYDPVLAASMGGVLAAAAAMNLRPNYANLRPTYLIPEPRVPMHGPQLPHTPHVVPRQPAPLARTGDVHARVLQSRLERTTIEYRDGNPPPRRR